MSKRIILFVLVSSVWLAACQGAPATPALPQVAPPPQVALPTAEVTVITVVATSVPTNIPFSTAAPPTVAPSQVASPTASASLPTPTVPPRTATRPPAAATSTRPRSTPTTAPPAAPPGTLLDGDYVSTGSIRIQFTVSGGGALADGGFFNFHCPVDGALETYGFTSPAAIVGGKFAFSALPAASGEPRVTMVCTVTTSTQARCTLRDLAATNKCLDVPATANRK